MNRKVLNTGIKLLILLILLADLSYSFIQHYNMPLDGDLAHIVVPAEEYSHILKDPLGISVLTDGKEYANPNRYFFHWTTVKYFRLAPNILQHITEPISSVYLACALAKSITQLLLLLLIVWYTSGFRRIWSYSFLVPAFLIFSLFQTMGYNRFMGIVDSSIVYTFAYAWPIIPMLVFYLPVYRFFTGQKPFKLKTHWFILLSFLAVFLSLNGPLVPAQMIIINGLVVSYWLISGARDRNGRGVISDLFIHLRKMPGRLLLMLLFSSLMSMYSLTIGLFNSLDAMAQITITEYYSRLPIGLYTLITTKLGWPILFAFIIANIILLLRGTPDREKQQMLVLFKWILFFCLIYIILLPLGGYRWYRPNAIRYDTFIPVTLACIFIFARSTYYLLKTLRSNYRLIYAIFILGFVLLFTLNDTPNFGANSCEIEQLKKLATSEENPVAISDECTLLSWEIITEPVDSELQGELIYHWNITSEKKTYYQVTTGNN